jgi:hypothetical protein
MLKQIMSAVAATFFFCAPALADSATGLPSTAKPPVLSGSYVYSWSESCLTPALATSVASGLASFDSTTGTATLKDWNTSHSGNKYVLLSESGSATYSNTATTLTFNPGTANATTYKVTYGAVTGGIATYVSYVGVVVDSENASCADLATLMRQ